MAAADLLKRNPTPSASDVRQAMTNLCRCGTYERILAAILDAAAKMRGGQSA
jgi:isoquinoline 1-oxidoreductase alpha subunit